MPKMISDNEAAVRRAKILTAARWCFLNFGFAKVFHFLTAAEQSATYVRHVTNAVKSGHVIIGTFGPDGPTKCSGLDVIRYDAESLHDQFGVRFRLEESSKELHRTQFGTTQQFLYCYCKV